MNLDLSHVIGAFSNPTPFTVERFSAAGYDNQGRALPSVKTTFDISAVKKPAKGKDAVLSADGQRTIETFVILTTTELRAADNQDGTPADRILIDGRPFEITSGKAYGNLGNYCRYIAVLLPSDAPPVGGPSAGATLFARTVTVEPIVDLVATNAQDALAELQTNVSTRATIDALEELASELDDLSGAVALKATAAEVVTLRERIDTIETSLASKASASDLSTLTNRVTNNETAIAGKANASDLTTHTNATTAHGVTGSFVGTSGSQTLADKTHTSTVADGSTAVAHTFDTANTLVNAGAKLLSWLNKGVEKLFVAANGALSILGVPSGSDAIIIPPGSRIKLGNASTGNQAIYVANGFVYIDSYLDASIIRGGRGVGSGSAFAALGDNGLTTWSLYGSAAITERFIADTTATPGNANASQTSHPLITKTSIGRAAVAVGQTSVTITTATAKATQNIMITPRQVDPNVKTFGAKVFNGTFTVTLDAAPSAPWAFQWELQETK